MTKKCDCTNLEKNTINNIEDELYKICDCNDMFLYYECAIKEIKTKFDILNTEFQVKYKRNPINTIKARLKSKESLISKINKLKIEKNIISIKENIEDIAGVRVICSYIDDIYKIADALINQDDIELIKRKDYIAEPKKNGYRSLHLIVKVPVFFSDNSEKVKVEVQIRTIAMDFWASLEHQMKYKNTELDNVNTIISKLTECADVISLVDKKMQRIRKEIEELKNINNDKITLI